MNRYVALEIIFSVSLEKATEQPFHSEIFSMIVITKSNTAVSYLINVY